jgi:LacI family transcriptional regulator
MKTWKQVALFVETSRAYGRDVLQGVRRYYETHGGWRVFAQPRGLWDPPPPWLERWNGDGIIARIATPAMARAIAAVGIPTVDVRLSFPELNVARVGVDGEKTMRMAVHYLTGLGFRRLAFCGVPENENSLSPFRRDVFVRAATEAGCSCNVFSAEPLKSHPWNWERSRMVHWLRSLERPVGIAAFNDDRAWEVLEAAREAGISVPDEAAVVGVDNDEYVCAFAQPTLTSIDVGAVQVGYRAAELLDDMMRKRRRPRTIDLSPVRVVERRSSRMIPPDDPQLSSFVKLLHHEACSGRTIEQMMADQPLSRSTLHRRFVAWCGRSPKAELQRLRLERARQLLADTNQTVEQISAACGFAHPKHLCRLFRQRARCTPLEYRAGAGPSERK